jgi:pantoate--beta-alanine ligase
MKVFKKISPLQKYLQELRKKNKTIGFVPTMGALHEGHLSLIRRAREENDIVVVSIFVNPKQFGPSEDYLRYPRPFNRDKKLCIENKVDILFAPPVEEMYPEGYLTYVDVENLSEKLCGKFRKGHFRGVATVVCKLFNIVGAPTRAYFGKKDFQQLQIIRRMVRDLNFQIEVVPCETVRDVDGLALSSRNTYLTPEERTRALSISKALFEAKRLIVEEGVRDVKKILTRMKNIIKKSSPTKIDYIKLVDPETLDDIKGELAAPMSVLLAVAVWYGKARLIDNILVSINDRKKIVSKVPRKA